MKLKSENVKTITSFKIFKKGTGGMEINSEELSAAILGEGEDAEVFKDEINRLRKKAVPAPIIKSLETLKYYFLCITGYWITPYDKFLDPVTLLPKDPNESDGKGRVHFEALWQSVMVTQVRMDAGSFTLLGVIDVIEDKPLALNPQKITVEDNLDYFGDVRERIAAVMVLVFNYFRTVSLEDIVSMRKYLLGNADEVMKAEIAKFDESQIVNMVMDELANKGAVVLINDEIHQLKAHESAQGSIEDGEQQIKTEDLSDKGPSEEFEDTDGAGQESTEDPPADDTEQAAEAAGDQMDSGDDWGGKDQAPDKVPNPYGPSASEGDASPAEQSSETFEHTQNMGGEDVSDQELEI